MGWITKSLVALGLLGAVATVMPTPSLAQGVYLGGPDFGVRIGRPAYRERYYRGYHDYDYDYRRGHCRTVTIERDDGSVRRIRRCD